MRLNRCRGQCLASMCSSQTTFQKARIDLNQRLSRRLDRLLRKLLPGRRRSEWISLSRYLCLARSPCSQISRRVITRRITNSSPLTLTSLKLTILTLILAQMVDNKHRVLSAMTKFKSSFKKAKKFLPINNNSNRETQMLPLPTLKSPPRPKK